MRRENGTLQITPNLGKTIIGWGRLGMNGMRTPMIESCANFRDLFTNSMEIEGNTIERRDQLATSTEHL